MKLEIEDNQQKKHVKKRTLPDVLNGHYVIVGKKGNVHYHTLSFQRKACIEKFLDGGMLSWKHCRQLGWKCLKVNVYFETWR